MAHVDPYHRQQLTWYRFDRLRSGYWRLCLLPYYAELFGDQHPELVCQARYGWRNSRSGRAKYIHFKSLTPEDQQKVRSFLADYEKHVILTTGKNIERFVGNDLESCLALDFNSTSPRDFEGTRTMPGRLVYRAKNRKCLRSIQRLAQLLAAAFSRIPFLRLEPKPSLSYVPAKRGRRDYLPMLLVQDLATILVSDGVIDPTRPVIGSSLSRAKQEAKNLSWEQKLSLWDQMCKKGFISLDHGVDRRTIVIVDDLYQSGATLHRYAGYIKECGATRVHGLVCVKTLRDSHN